MYTECPECGSKDIWRDEVDVGVGNVYGPFHCNECGWLEYNYYADIGEILADFEKRKGDKQNGR